MSESSTTIGSLFDAQRTIIDRTIETQQTINSQGLDLTRRAVRPVVGAAVGSGSNAEEQVDDAFETLDETQATMLEDVQYVAERPVDTSQSAAEWGIGLLDRQVGRIQPAGETAEQVTGEVADSAEETAEAVADSAEETAEGVAEATEVAVAETTDATREAVETSEAVTEDAVDDLQVRIDEASDEFAALEDVDETAVEGLAATGIETLSDLATAHSEAVADASDVTEDAAEEWIDAAVAYEGDAVSDLEGVGETYSHRLAAAGIRTQDQLARTSAHEVAEVAEVAEDRAVEWVQRAQDEA